MNHGPITAIRHRIGAFLMDFSVDHLLRPDVAAVFREQLNAGKAAVIRNRQVKVSLRADLLDPLGPSVDPASLTAGGPGMAPHEAVDAALKAISPEARKHIEWGDMRAAINAATPYVDAQRLRDLNPMGPGTFSPHPDPNQLPEGI